MKIKFVVLFYTNPSRNWVKYTPMNLNEIKEVQLSNTSFWISIFVSTLVRLQNLLLVIMRNKYLDFKHID